MQSLVLSILCKNKTLAIEAKNYERTYQSFLVLSNSASFLYVVPLIFLGRIARLFVGYSKYIPVFISYTWLYRPGKILYFWVFFLYFTYCNILHEAVYYRKRGKS